MAYAPFQTYYPSYGTQYQQLSQPVVAPTPQPQNNSGLIWVQGEAGAKSFFVAAGQTVMLMDSEESRFFLKSSDSSGMPLPLRVFSYTEQTASSTPKMPAASETSSNNGYVTREEFEALKAQINSLQARITRESGNNAESDF